MAAKRAREITGMTIAQCSSNFLDGGSLSDQSQVAAHSDPQDPSHRRGIEPLPRKSFYVPLGYPQRQSQLGQAVVRARHAILPITHRLHTVCHIPYQSLPRLTLLLSVKSS